MPLIPTPKLGSGVDVMRGDEVIVDPDLYMNELCGAGGVRERNVDRWVRNVACQAQVAYLRWRSVPRFQPLSEREHGAWP